MLLGAINNPRSLKRVAEWGDGWIPIVSSIDEFKEGAGRIKAYCSEFDRDPNTLDFTVFGLGDQWKSKAEIEQLEATDANRVVLWLAGTTTDALKKELDELARELI